MSERVTVEKSKLIELIEKDMFNEPFGEAIVHDFKTDLVDIMPQKEVNEITGLFKSFYDNLHDKQSMNGIVSVRIYNNQYVV